MKILVTGGTGYIGSHTVVELLAKGYTPIIADDLSNSKKGVLESIEKITGKKVAFYEVDLCDKKNTEKIFDEHKIDATIHFAAWKAVGESVEKPLKYYRNNLVSLINLLEIYSDRKLDNFLFSSSCSVYGQSKILPVTETTPLQKAESPYGNTKQIGEEILADSIRANGFHAIALRYFNPAGAHESALIGELPLQPPTNLVPVITQTAIGKRESVTVHGSDYGTPDGTCIRDYVHVVDIANAHILAVERLINKKTKNNYELYNLGSGNGNSVLEAINAFEKVSEKKLNYIMGPRRPGDVEKVWADTSLSKEELNWICKFNLEDIMRTAWKWEQFLQNNNI
jgi:UDP-glucose 4-epimerase